MELPKLVCTGSVNPELPSTCQLCLLYRPSPSEVNTFIDVMLTSSPTFLNKLQSVNASKHRHAKAVVLLDMISLFQVPDLYTHRDGQTIDLCLYHKKEMII